MSKKKYNVLLLMTDQHRFDALGCYGNDVIETVNIDYIASRGTIFKNAYTPSPSCIPARACLMTGMNQWNTGILGMGKGQGHMGVNFPCTLPSVLSSAGYQTQGVGKMHFFPQRALNGFHNTLLDESGREESLGFISDYKKWFKERTNIDDDITDHGISWNSWMSRPYHMDERLHATYWTVDKSIDFLKTRDPSKPFFLKTSFARPHSPYDPPKWYYNLYDNKDIPKTKVGNWADIHDDKKDAASPDAWRGKRKDIETARARGSYYGSIHFIDHQIGRLINYMKRNGLYDDTIVIFTSDHGDMLGDHNLWRKTYAYEGSSHIPMIIKLPDDFEAKEIMESSDKPVSLYDIMPTILDVLDINIPSEVDGQSMLSLIKGEDVKWREFVHGEHSTCYSELQEMQYLTDGKIKYIWFPRIGEEQLFDLEHDPYEQHELSKDKQYKGILLKWRKRLGKILTDRGYDHYKNGELISQAGKKHYVSPKYKERYDSSDYKW